MSDKGLRSPYVLNWKIKEKIKKVNGFGQKKFKMITVLKRSIGRGYYWWYRKLWGTIDKVLKLRGIIDNLPYNEINLLNTYLI